MTKARADAPLSDPPPDSRAELLPELVIERRLLVDLHHQPGNARTHNRKNIDAIKGSLEEFGQVAALLIDAEGMVVAGNGTLDAMTELGWDSCDVTVADPTWPAEKVRALALVLNRTAELAGWDKAALATEIADLTTWGKVPIVGWTPAEMGKIRRDDPSSTVVDDPAVPHTPKRAKSKRGDVWILGAHRLMCGDSFKEADVVTLLGEQRAGLVLTDPPYAIYGSSTGVSSDIADDEMVRPFFEALGRMIHQHAEDFAHVYIHCDWRSYAAVWESMKAAELTPKNCLVWDKGSFGLGANWPNTHEFIAYFAKLPPHAAVMGTSKNQVGQRTINEPGNVLRFERPRGKERRHNAAKPVDLLELIIEKASDPGDVVLDLFGGSGSTLLAAERAGRVACLMEKKPVQVDVICQRFQEVTGIVPLRGGEPVSFVKAAAAK